MEKINGETSEKQDGATASITLIMGAEQIGDFSSILQQGFGMTAMVPCTVSNLLCDQFGLSREYVSKRITTIFLDGKTTDNIDDAMVRDHSTIALSAAMPGVVGATLRRGSYYSAMRSAITCTDKGKTGASREGLVFVKLFNLLLPELGTEFLKNGIFLNSSELLNFFLHEPDSFWRGCGEALLNGKPVVPTSLKHSEAFANSEIIKLSIAII
jgi:hypothetical protein